MTDRISFGPKPSTEAEFYGPFHRIEFIICHSDQSWTTEVLDVPVVLTDNDSIVAYAIDRRFNAYDRFDAYDGVAFVGIYCREPGGL